jgi:hypothetical protein
MSRADYHFNVVEVFQDDRAVKIVDIVDENLGNMSVTNDVENVILEIAKILPNKPTDYAWIYRDSDNQIDELVLDRTGNFDHFAPLPRGRCKTEVFAEAVVRLLERELEAAYDSDSVR